MDMKRLLGAVAASAAVSLLAGGCGSSSPSSGGAGTSSSPVVLRLGYLENITHAPALIGIREGFFSRDLGKNVTLKLFPYSTGTEEATAILAGQLDAAYVGPNPAIEAWQKSPGLVRVISGVASGGAALVVKKSITAAAELKGQKLSSPSVGNTQDVSLRYFLKQHGFTTTTTGGGDVHVTPVSPNSAAVLQFESGEIAGGWEPAPYDVEMVAAGGHELVDEASLWPDGQFVTTNLIVTSRYLKANPAVVTDLLKANIESVKFIQDDKSAAENAANAELTALTGKGLKSGVLDASFAQVSFTTDPIASSLLADAQHAEAVGVLSPVKDLGGIFDLGPLNKLLAADGESQVSS
jgi:NitT/TauT family transport system substrate-binding protein